MLHVFRHLRAAEYMPNMLQFTSDSEVVPVLRSLQSTADRIVPGVVPILEPYQTPWPREDWASYLEDLAPVLLPNNRVNPAPPPFEVRFSSDFSTVCFLFVIILTSAPC